MYNALAWAMTYNNVTGARIDHLRWAEMLEQMGPQERDELITILREESGAATEPDDEPADSE